MTTHCRSTLQIVEKHLRDVIAMVEKRKAVELLYGIGHDVTRYYERTVTITGIEQLAGAMTEQLTPLFDQDPEHAPASWGKRELKMKGCKSSTSQNLTRPERLIMLRDQMRKSGIAFLIPRADVHQGEYVAYDERLAWLTGFEDRLVFVPLHRMPRGSSLMAATASKSG